MSDDDEMSDDDDEIDVLGDGADIGEPSSMSLDDLIARLIQIRDALPSDIRATATAAIWCNYDYAYLSVKIPKPPRCWLGQQPK